MSGHVNGSGPHQVPLATMLRSSKVFREQWDAVGPRHRQAARWLVENDGWYLAPGVLGTYLQPEIQNMSDEAVYTICSTVVGLCLFYWFLVRDNG